MIALLTPVLVAAALGAPGLPPELATRCARVDWTPVAIDRLAREMPKVEAHVHLDGALAPETILALARRQRYAPLADLPLAEIRRRTVVDAPRESLAAVLAAFETFYPLLRNREAMHRAAFDLTAAAARQRTRYVEVRFAPALQAAPGFDQAAVLAAVLAGLREGRRRFGVESAVILCLIRPPSFVDLAANRETLALALTRRGRGVVAIDLAGNEAAEPLATYAELVRSARAGGLGTTVHAGEVAGSHDLETALALGVDRVSHATVLAQRPELLAEIVRRGIPIEVNLTSNLRTGAVTDLRAHPARDWFRAGARLALSTDDPGVFGIDLRGEYLRLIREVGFTPEEAIAVALQGVDALFLPAAERARLRRRMERDLARLLDRLPRHAERRPTTSR